MLHHARFLPNHSSVHSLPVLDSIGLQSELEDETLNSKKNIVVQFMLRRIILKWIFERLDGEAWTGSIWLRLGQVAGCYEYGDEPSGSIKCGEFLEWFRTF